MSSLKHLRIVALLEATSYLVLLFVAMPLKYLAGEPMATRVAGSLHGLLFLLFMMALYRVYLERKWPITRALTAVAATLTPFAAFVFDRSLRKEMQALRAASLGEGG